MTPAPIVRHRASILGQAPVLAYVLFGLSAQLKPVVAQDFLQTFNYTGFESNLRGAFDAALRCGAEASPAQRGDVVAALTPMWRSLPKNSQGRIQWRMVRYIAHRYFMRKSSLMIRGFEPTRLLSGTSKGTPDILTDRAPLHLKALLSSKHGLSYGFGLDDVARLVLVLEKLIYESQSGLLAEIYRRQGTPLGATISQESLASLLEEYMVHWMMSADVKGIEVLTAKPELREDTFPGWKQTLAYTRGQVRAMGYAREHAPPVSRGQKAFRAREFAFEDAHEVVGSITTSFASYWEPQCSSMKKVLFEMDRQHTGRVPLASFYSAALDSEWHFTESEAYLRELGALDETSEWLGSQVIIPNYVQAAPNCIITTRHYWLCCRNECEDIFSEIETTVGASTASPEDLLQVVGNMTAQESLDDDATPALAGALSEQLQTIAKAHQGRVPLHGRLFAQWLHYVFPRQCPFPHRTGKATAISPIEFGSGSEATREEMLRHTSTASAEFAILDVNASAGAGPVLARAELEWMSQWSAEEELLTDDGLELRAPWSDGVYLAVAGMTLLVASLVGALRLTLKIPEEDLREGWLQKMH
eukprot:CAMPEP_0175646394 /NCGR_PEP_ID=MMETSP0097-20121207/7299_1 /TAXON_ID=311494 /ORGANISM="Alexandrium monilatum, Strain CCMP3105" /LENGTH=587 /DNA_ID=CAMNT_0016952291 /DNA_START=33 /DNA_END=1793 /DNA_ORIENTATION=+